MRHALSISAKLARRSAVHTLNAERKSTGRPSPTYSVAFAEPVGDTPYNHSHSWITVERELEEFPLEKAPGNPGLVAA